MEAGALLGDADSLRRLAVNVVDGVPVYRDDIAAVLDGPAEPQRYTWIGFGPADRCRAELPGVYPAVTLAMAKRKGANAVRVAREAERRLASLAAELFPPASGSWCRPSRLDLVSAESP